LVRERGLQRLDYQVGNHHIHASAWGIVFTEYDFRGRRLRLTGPTNVGFLDPARISLLSVLLATTALVNCSQEDPDLLHLATQDALEKIAADALILFEEAEDAIASMEAAAACRGQ
jgi:hypothetical protein